MLNFRGVCYFPGGYFSTGWLGCIASGEMWLVDGIMARSRTFDEVLSQEKPGRTAW